MSRASVCAIEGCNKPSKHRGWCGMHYQRWQRHGDPMAETVPRYRSLEEAFQAGLPTQAEQTGCLLWTGATTADGYGNLSARGAREYAHRYAWERVHGPLPQGHLIDHICYSPACVEITHLRPADKPQNSWNRAGSPLGSALGVRGVSRKRNRYRVRAMRNGIEYSGGTFSSITEAAEAAEALRQSLYGEFHGRG